MKNFITALKLLYLANISNILRDLKGKFSTILTS